MKLGEGHRDLSLEGIERVESATSCKITQQLISLILQVQPRRIRNSSGGLNHYKGCIGVIAL